MYGNSDVIKAVREWFTDHPPCGEGTDGGWECRYVKEDNYCAVGLVLHELGFSDQDLSALDRDNTPAWKIFNKDVREPLLEKIQMSVAEHAIHPELLDELQGWHDGRLTKRYPQDGMDPFYILDLLEKKYARR